MAKTFLEAINDSLKEVNIIQGSAGELTTFTDSARQTDIDLMIKSWNDALGEIKRIAVFRGEVAEGSFILADGTREYTLETDFLKMAVNPIDSTNVNMLLPYKGGYVQMKEDQLNPADFTGRPTKWVQNLNNTKLRINTTPGASEDGETYTYEYEKEDLLTLIADTFPFPDSAVEAVQDVAVQIWRRKRNKEFDERASVKGIALAVHLIIATQPKGHYARGTA